MTTCDSMILHNRCERKNEQVLSEKGHIRASYQSYEGMKKGYKNETNNKRNIVIREMLKTLWINKNLEYTNKDIRNESQIMLRFQPQFHTMIILMMLW